MSTLKTADEYRWLASRARADAWCARTLDARATSMLAEINCEMMARSIEKLEGLKDALQEQRMSAFVRSGALD
jgi:hypothetical protein